MLMEVSYIVEMSTSGVGSDGVSQHETEIQSLLRIIIYLSVIELSGSEEKAGDGS